MTEELITEQVIQIITDELGCDDGEVTLESRLQEDLGADSLDMVECTWAIEKKFDIIFDEGIFERMKTAKDLITETNSTLNKTHHEKSITASKIS